MPHATLKKGRNGKPILEFEVTIRIPVDFEAVRRTVVSNIHITAREKLVFDELVRGSSNQEISDIVHISVRTVKFHVSSLLKKFHVRNRYEFVALALSQGTENGQTGSAPPKPTGAEVRHA